MWLILLFLDHYTLHHMCKNTIIPIWQKQNKTKPTMACHGGPTSKAMVVGLHGQRPMASTGMETYSLTVSLQELFVCMVRSCSFLKSLGNIINQKDNFVLGDLVWAIYCNYNQSNLIDLFVADLMVIKSYWLITILIYLNPPINMSLLYCENIK
jgi:hypothetical protein